MLEMVCFQVQGLDAAVSQACRAGDLELNVMMPLVAYNILFALKILCRAMEAFETRCVRGIEADPRKCLLYAEMSPAVATALSPVIGYKRAAEVATEAVEKGKTVKELVVEKGLLSEKEAERILDPSRLAGKPWRQN